MACLCTGRKNAIVIICCFFFSIKTFDLAFPQFYCLFNPKKLIIKLKEAISQKEKIPPVWKKMLKDYDVDFKKNSMISGSFYRHPTEVLIISRDIVPL